MNNSRAKEISEYIPNEDLLIMLTKAKAEIKDWTIASKANKGLSRGCHWNIFCKDFDVNKQYSPIVKFRMIQEYGVFLPHKYQPTKKEKAELKPTHHDPIFNW